MSIVGFFLAVFPLYGDYVVTGTLNPKGAVEVYSYFKGYQDEWVVGTPHRELAVKYGISWTALDNLELYLNPPLIRYHLGLGSDAQVGVGDADIGGKIIFFKKQPTCGKCPTGECVTLLGAYAFARLPTGASDLPLYDKWCPKFSNEEVGGGAKLVFTQKCIKSIMLHLNIGFLKNIGDLQDTLNPISDTRVPLGIGLSLPFGLFIEGETDVNSYGDKVAVTENPKTVVVGINRNLSPRIKFLLSAEAGTWGTLDPPLNVWYKGYYEAEEYPWAVTLGLSYSPTVHIQSKEEIAALARAKELEAELAKTKDELTQKGDEYTTLESESAKLKADLLALQQKFDESAMQLKYEIHQVKKGECLWKIAGSPEVYGKGNGYLWSLIYHTNKGQIKRPRFIYPGQQLNILKLPPELCVGKK
ncbi:MAG: LysM peptidoglycan-binding domain-containing protein [Candidatus Stahlbacteria bacterium]|nr:LysM peptidoglycan-binding domain-containing protein [Candidatus Stahlbacteria bacterium]